MATPVGMEKPFAIAHFTGDDSLYVVPMTWVIAEKKCYFPPTCDKAAKKLIKAQSAFQEDWPLYDIKILRRYGN